MKALTKRIIDRKIAIVSKNTLNKMSPIVMYPKIIEYTIGKSIGKMNKKRKA